jgi:hypothetical protein
VVQGGPGVQVVQVVQGEPGVREVREVLGQRGAQEAREARGQRGVQEAQGAQGAQEWHMSRFLVWSASLGLVEREPGPEAEGRVQ